MTDGRVEDGHHAVESGSGRSVIVRKLADRYGITDDDQLPFIRTRYGTIRNLGHPGIVPLIDLLELKKGTFLVEEYTGGITLRDLVAACREEGFALSPSAFVIVGNQLARALIAAHKQEIVHGKLSTRNIMIDQNRDLRITDFMFLPPKRPGILRQGRYAAPELQRPFPAFSRYSDIYAMAIVLTEIVAVPAQTDKGKLMLPSWFRQHLRPFVTALHADPGKRDAGFRDILDILKNIEVEKVRKRDIEDFTSFLRKAIERHAS